MTCSSAPELWSGRCDSKATSRKVADQVPKVGELELKVKLLVDDAGKLGDLEKALSAKKAELASAKSALEASEAFLNAKDRDCSELSFELGLALAATA